MSLDLGLHLGLGLGSSAAFSPLSLFAAGEKGGWYDPSDLSTLKQNSNGTGAVASDGDPVGYIADKSGNGNHLIQATAANRPLYKTAGGLHWLQFDGSNDELAIASMAAGGAAVATLCLGIAFTDTSGFDGFVAAGTFTGRFWQYGNGTLLNNLVGGTTGDPTLQFDPVISATPKVHTSRYDLAGANAAAVIRFRLDGADQVGVSVGDATAGGTFQDGAFILGNAAPAGVLSACKIYGAVIRYAATASPATLETYIGAKAGLVL